MTMRTILLGFEQDTLSEEQLNQVQAMAPDMRILVTRDRDEIEIAAGSFPRNLLPAALPGR
jgi:hypothetical protein